MASASLPRRKSLSEQQALARLQEMVAADSDGGEVSFAQQLTDASSEESEMETEEEPNMPPRKMRRGTGKPSPSQTAKDGTVWAEEDTGSVTARAGPTESAKRKITGVLQSFLCLLDVEILQTITECTVRQARRTEPDWKLTIHELMAFISILFVRAIMCPVGAIVDCWSEIFLVPVIKETMPRDRFVSIMQHLRFDDKDTRAERVKTDRFAAISDIWTRFTKNCAESFTPGDHVTINEQLFPTKVRCPFTQYISSKPGKFGMKFWIATDLETKYVCNASPYLGKDPSHQGGEGLPENVVMSLVEPFLDDGRNVLTIYAQKKTVCLLSSLHRDVAIGDGRKRKPNTITDYNHMKCGVNVLNQMARMYSVRAATHRWPVAVFYNILDLAAMNAHILYKACTGSTEKRRVFMAHLAEELRRCFMQQKGIEKEMKMRLRQASVPQLAPGKKTQCQVLRHCNRNHSTERCVQCDRYTCRKCRKEGPWVCDDC